MPDLGQSEASYEPLTLLPKRDPDALIRQAKDEHQPIVTVCLFSGGNDSTVLAHRCREHYDHLVWIDTGTAVPGVREFVEHFAANTVGKQLRIYAAGDAYRNLVLSGFGFPGPAQHHRAYNRLKERQLERMLRDLKQGRPRTARVLALTGIRHAESQRRAARMPVTRRGSLAFVNPLIDWTDLDTRVYRREQRLPQSDPAALLHRSGECNCGAFAAVGEREELRSLWPLWFEQTIVSLEREAEAAGVLACRWGERPGEIEGDALLCSDCQLRMAV